mmetsp:Transcript_26903/g.34858  ORF Transcript_26903/g.34858 Transcript_26903/m.34858 type:complete len:219 (-) Transcript_26903:253-909(-)
MFLSKFHITPCFSFLQHPRKASVLFPRDFRKQKRKFSFSFPGPRKLEEIVKLPLLSKETPERVSEIWKEFHNQRKDTLATTLCFEDFQVLLERGADCPIFVYPIWRDAGHFMLISQFQDTHFLVTYLEEYQNNPGGAQPWLVLSTYSDFAESKNLGLIRGDYTPNLNGGEAEKVFHGILSSYCTDEKFQQVECFNKSPEKFNLYAYMKVCSSDEEHQS